MLVSFLKFENIGRKRVRILFIAICMASMAMSCNKTGDKSTGDSAATTESVQEEFIADYDIAMTVRSIADAINLGEPLDTAEYNFEGVLTDGQGTPLYTDIQGSPGEWEVDVTGDKSVRIRNIYLGDLLPENLTDYLTGTLQLDVDDEVKTDEYHDDEETSLEVYDFGGGDIRFETRMAFAPNGLEGPLMSIVLVGHETTN